MAKVITKALARIHRLKDTIAILTHREAKLAHIEAIRARVSRSEVPIVISHTPVYWQRPAKGYRLPSYSAWRRWLESRIGILPIVNDMDGARVLCIACGFPIAVSTGDKTRRGTRDNKVIENGGLSKVIVGAIVKLKDTEDIAEDWKTGPHGYMEISHAGYDDEAEENDKILVVTHRALGCDCCQRQYAKVKAEVTRENNKKRDTFHRTRTEYMDRVRQLISQSPDMPLAEQQALLRFTGDTPKDKTPYIAVDVKVIHPEQTVAYWHGQEFKPAFIRKAIVKSYGPDIEPTNTDAWIPITHIAYALLPSLEGMAFVLNVHTPVHRHEFTYESDIPFTPTRVPRSTDTPQATARETIPRRIYIPLTPIGICHHARGVMPIVRTGRRPGIY